MKRDAIVRRQEGLRPVATPIGRRALSVSLGEEASIAAEELELPAGKLLEFITSDGLIVGAWRVARGGPDDDAPLRAPMESNRRGLRLAWCPGGALELFLAGELVARVRLGAGAEPTDWSWPRRSPTVPQ